MDNETKCGLENLIQEMSGLSKMLRLLTVRSGDAQQDMEDLFYFLAEIIDGWTETLETIVK